MMSNTDKAREAQDAREHAIDERIPAERRAEAWAAADQAGDAFAREQVLESYARPAAPEEQERWTDAARSPLLVGRGVPAEEQPGEPVTDDELAEVERLDREASQDWWLEDECVFGFAVDEDEDGYFATVQVAREPAPADADFMVLARTLLPKLVTSERAARLSLNEANAALRRLVAEADELRAKARAFDLLRADYESARDGKIPCGHKVEDLIHGGPDADGLPAVAQCGHCLADRQAAREKLPRTPERVLRAMLKAYEKATLEVGVTTWSDPDNAALDRRENVLLGALGPIRGALVYVLAGRGDPTVCLGRVSRVGRDYEARLRGERPLNAPPAEV